MKKIRIVFNILIVVSTSLLIGILAYENLVGKEYPFFENLFLQIMHFSLFIGAIINLIHLRKNEEWNLFYLTSLPLFLYLISVVGLFTGFQFDAIFLLGFDFFILFWFYFLLIKEIFIQKEN